MAAMIGRSKTWFWWLAGFLCALVFGRGVTAGEAAKKYGVNVRPPAVEPGKPRPPAAEEKPAASLEESGDWKTIVEAWNFAKPLGDSHKSTTAQRKEADDKLKAAREAGDKLVAAGLLVAAEAGLLSAEQDRIRADVYRDPPTDSQVTCYDRMMLSPAQQSFDRLSKRLPLLEELVKGGKVHSSVADKVLGTIEADVAALSDEKQLAALKDKKAEAGKTRDAVKAEVEKLRKLLDAGKPKVPAGEGRKPV
jgi:hypothetical protein